MPPRGRGVPGIADYMDEFGDRVPKALEAELAAAMARVAAAQ
jgi:hypothetical protein